MLYLETGYRNKKAIMQEVKNVDSFEWLKEQIKSPAFATNKEYEAMYFISGQMKSLERLEKNVLERDLLILDYDHLQTHKYNNQTITYAVFKEQIEKTLSGYDYLIYPTYNAGNEYIDEDNDNQKSIDENYRVVIKLDRPLKKVDFECIGWTLINQIGMPADSSTIDWGRVQGAPVLSPTNQQAQQNSYINAVNKSYPVASHEQLEESGAIERAKAIKKDLTSHTEPKKDRVSNFEPNEYNLPSTLPKAEYGQNLSFIDDATAISIIKDYTKIKTEVENLSNYNNYLSASMQVLKAIQRGQISYDAGLECVEILALGNEDWAEENRKKFEREYDKDTEVRNGNYDFIGKFVLGNKNAGMKQKYSHLIGKMHHNDKNNAVKEFDRINWDEYSYSTLPKEYLKYFEQLPAETKKALIERDSALNNVQGLLDKIKASLTQEVVKTGFPAADKLLSGGLRAGLYFNGAISSLGKTTWTMQVADNIAKQGLPVIIFSLEMSKYELIAKSLSRLTYEISVEDKKVLSPKMKQGDKPKYNALTYYQIVDAKNHKYFTDYQKTLLSRAIERYNTFAGNITIYEGLGDITAIDVRERVQTIIDITGKTPTIFIDYLQILAPEIERGNDKQNTDRAVLHLKQLSRDFDTPVFAISNLNRASYTAEMNMTAFKESGAIEYGSDVLLGMQLSAVRDAKTVNGKKDIDIEEEKRKTPRLVELKMMKQRNGVSSGSVDFEFLPMFNYFREIGKVENKPKFELNFEQVPSKKSNCLKNYKGDDINEAIEQVTKEDAKKLKPAGEQQALDWFSTINETKK